MTLRVLILGVPEENIPTIDGRLDIQLERREWTEYKKEPILHDYDVIITDVKFINEQYQHFKKKFARFSKKETIQLDNEIEFSESIESAKEFIDEQLSTGGLLICFVDEKRSWRRYNYSFHGKPRYGSVGSIRVPSTYKSPDSYAWCPISINLANEKGETVIPTSELGGYEKLIAAFKKEDINWTCHFKQASLPGGTKVMLTNRAGYPISLKIPHKKGLLVFLPRFSSVRYALKVIIEQVLVEQYHVEVLEMRKTIRPDWIKKYEYEIKREKLERMKSIETELDGYTRLEELLYTQGDQLREATAFAFRRLGFDAKIPPERGPVQDIELSLGDYEAVVEVKGKKEHATLRDLRQLLQYYIDKKEFKGKKKVKAVFVVNHYCFTDVEERKDPYVREAIKLAEKYNMCLLTSTDLYAAIEKCLKGETAIKEIQEKLMTGKGYVRL